MSLTLLVSSLLAGALTILAPCILPLLPVIVGGSALGGESSKKASRKRAFVVTLSLVVSVVVFSLLLKGTTALLGVPPIVWTFISGGIVVVLGVLFAFPSLWEKLMIATNLQALSTQALGASQDKSGLGRDILMGAALGPVFNSCSPTYGLIVAVLLPASFASGLVYLMAYALGLGVALFIVSLLGQTAIRRLLKISSSEGMFKRVIGILFIIVGVAIIFGWDRQLQTFIIDQGWYAPISSLEMKQ